MLPDKLKEKLLSLLREQTGVLIWQSTDMVGVPRHVIEHNLSDTLGTKPVR